MSDQKWETLDIEKVLKKKQEQTTSANVGGFAVPLGPSRQGLGRVLRPAVPKTPMPPYKTVKKKTEKKKD